TGFYLFDKTLNFLCLIAVVIGAAFFNIVIPSDGPHIETLYDYIRANVFFLNELFQIGCVDPPSPENEDLNPHLSAAAVSSGTNELVTDQVLEETEEMKLELSAVVMSSRTNEIVNKHSIEETEELRPVLSSAIVSSGTNVFVNNQQLEEVDDQEPRASYSLKSAQERLETGSAEWNPYND
ncbi:hypothetical protein HK098_006674, partial [Nowakowskiella sp. JEL0407]